MRRLSPIEYSEEDVILTKYNSRKKISVLLLIFVLVLSIIAYFYLRALESNLTQKTISPIGKEPSFTQKVTQAIIPKSQLVKAIEKRLKDEQGTYALVIKNLKTNETFSLNENQQFTSASLYKLWVMATAYDKINQGVMSENDDVTLSREAIESIQGFYQDDVTEGVSLSVADAIEKMITVSDNDAAITLYEHMGHEEVEKFLQNNGFTASSFLSPPITTAHDIAQYYEKLYKGQIVNREYSQKMLDVLFRQRLNDRIPKYLPANTRVAHKTGELDTFKHDAGVVELEGSDYLIVVLTDTPNPENAAEVTANISKDVFDYFQAQSSKKPKT